MRLSQQRLNNALEALRDAKNTMGLVSVDAQRLVLQGAITAAESDRAQTHASLAASRAKLKVLHGTVAALPERVTTDEVVGHSDLALDQMRQQLYGLEIRQAEVTSKYTDAYPESRIVKEAVNKAAGILRKQEPNRTLRTTTLNHTRQQLELALLDEESNASSLAGRALEIDQQLAALGNRGRKLNDQETQIAQLQKQVDLCSAAYTTYATKLEQSNADQMLSSERVTNVNLLQPATYVARPVSPNKRAVLAMGLLLAIGASIGLALVAEYMSPSLPTPTDAFSQEASRRRPEAKRAAGNGRHRSMLATSSGEATRT